MSKILNVIIGVILVAIVGVLVYYFIGNKEIPISSITLSKHDITMYVGDSLQLDANILPPDSTNKEVIWESSNTSVLKVNNKKVYAIGYGNAFVTVKSSDGTVFDKCNVKVIAKEASSVELNEKNIEINKGEVKKLSLTIIPSDLINLVTWSSSDENIVTVNSNGLITGKSTGSAIIKAKYGSRESVCNVKVVIPVNSIRMENESVTLGINESMTLKLIVYPVEAINQKIEWKSSDDKIVSVDNNGKITGKENGTATITATIEGKKASCEVKSKGYIITEDNKFKSLTVVDSYNSDTLKYRIIQNIGYFVLVWVKDANKQWNSALPSLGDSFKAEDLLKKEINTYGYQQKGLVATNGSFFWAGWGNSPGIPFIINKGNIIRDIENKNYNKTVYGVLGINKDGLLRPYDFSSDDYTLNSKSKQEMLNEGVRNNFAYAITILDDDGSVHTGSETVNRTAICQVDKNNFVIYSGSESFNTIGNKFKNIFNCKVGYNLDGGGSRKLYYKTNVMSEAKKIYGGGRSVPDMMYFVEQ